MLSVPKGIPPTGIDKFIYPIKLNLIGAQMLHIQVTNSDFEKNNIA